MIIGVGDLSQHFEFEILGAILATVHYLLNNLISLIIEMLIAIFNSRGILW
jgi:hypothetical protein